MLAFMVFIFFCFSGLLAFMFHIFQTMEKQGRILRDDLAQVRVLLRALEARIDSQKSAQTVNNQPDHVSQLSGVASPVNVGEATGDPLLHLSFDLPRQETKQDVQEMRAFDPEFDLHIDGVPGSVRER